MSATSPRPGIDRLAQAAVRSALSASLLNAVVFTVFAYVTTQVKAVRHASPWQDDPYDTVVTFTMFFVPIVTALIVMRMLPCRRNRQLTLHRARQLLRAALVSALLVTTTYGTDCAAVIARANRALWDDGTPWLIPALAVASLPTWVTWVMLARTRGLLPRPSDDQVPGDWLDDALEVAELAAARLPPPAGRIAAWLERRDAAGWIRRRFTLVVAVMSLCAGLAVATALVRENGFGPLFFSETAWFAGGMYSFGMISNAVLQLTVQPRRGRVHQAVHIAIVAGAAALPVSLGLRSSILAATGLSAVRGTPGSITVLTSVSAMLIAAVAFTWVLARPSPR
jgi:hypothetical protein